MVLTLLLGQVMKLLLAVAVLATVATGTALAGPGGEPPPARLDAEPVAPPVMTLAPPSMVEPVAVPATTVTVSEWYGWQVLVADGATFGLAAATKHGELALGWIGSGAVVHLAHHNYGRAAASVGLRVGLPLLGASIGAASAQGCTGDFCGLGEVLVGGLLGMGAAEVIDLVLAKDEHEIAPARLSRSWTPVASVRHSGATVGIAAHF